MQFKKRTHTCGELCEEQGNENVVLNGWVDSRRDLGGLIFIYLRDRYGKTQIIFDPGENPETHNTAKKLRPEFVVSVEGRVRVRPDDMKLKDIPTGAVEVIADKLTIINEAETPPFQIKDEVDASEELRLKYRYLDLRRTPMQKAILLRHKMAQIARTYLDSQNFVEIETPVLMKSTPEGARDFLVPSRMNKQKFYALPQSPQTYKQLLMVSGFDRYFQIVKCFRDEDLRADRQPEFTQIDVEMSFVNQEDIFEIVEGLMAELFKQITGYELSFPIAKISYDEAMEKYGSDKPDLRFGMPMITLNEIVADSEFKVISSALESNGIVTALTVKNGAELSRKQIDDYTNYVKELGAGGLIWLKIKEDEIQSPIAKFLSKEEQTKIVESCKAEIGDLIFAIAGKRKASLEQLGALRLKLAKDLNLFDKNTPPSLLWVIDFPLFEWVEEDNRFYAMHHPFTSPRPEDLSKMESEPGNVKARAYDLVLNGNEIAGGSIRIHDSKTQAIMFKALGISEEEAESKFGFLMNAFKYGAPPHGGIAFGFDRLAMLLAQEDSIRQVIAFPKTTSGLSLMDDCPSPVDTQQLDDLGIQLKFK